LPDLLPICAENNQARKNIGKKKQPIARQANEPWETAAAQNRRCENTLMGRFSMPRLILREQENSGVQQIVLEIKALTSYDDKKIDLNFSVIFHSGPLASMFIFKKSVASFHCLHIVGIRAKRKRDTLT
jgi:hypothetical protein